MRTATTQEKLLDTAEWLFAEFGYAGTSIRQITAAADVSLPAVHYHFGSKKSLFREVLKRSFRPLDNARLMALDELEAEFTSEPPPVDRLVRALVEPALDRVVDPKHGASWLRLIWRLRMEGEQWSEVLPTLDLHMTMIRRYAEAFHRALPETPPRELRFQLFFMICTISNALIDDKTLPLLGARESSLREAPTEMGEALIRFVAAALENSADRRSR